jgi:hypothetical protein
MHIAGNCRESRACGTRIGAATLVREVTDLVSEELADAGFTLREVSS